MQELTITKNALERIKLIQDKEGNGFLRVTVDGGGCSGFSYSFNFDNKTLQDHAILIYAPNNATNSLTQACLGRLTAYPDGKGKYSHTI